MKKIVLLSILLYPLINQAQYEEPILTLNREMHTARINRIDTDSASKYILTCSHDKTAKLWSAESGDLLKTYRPPIGLGNKGILYAATISPDGKYVALGGRTNVYTEGHNIYIFETETGILMHRIAGLSGVIIDLEFSKDGRYLATALGDTNGIRIYESTNWVLVFKDSSYKANSNDIDFSVDGHLISVCDDGYLRLYSPGFQLLKKVKAPRGQQPYFANFSPNGQSLAVAYYNSPKLRVLDSKDLTLLYKPKIGFFTTLGDRFNIVSFSQEGKHLIAGGLHENLGNEWHYIRVWDENGKGRFRDYPTSYNTILDVKPFINDRIIFSSAQPDWGVLGLNTGDKNIYKKREQIDYSKINAAHFKINNNGRIIGLRPTDTKSRIKFNIDTRELEDIAVAFPINLKSKREISILDWKKKLSFLSEYETCHSIDATKDSKSTVLGTDWNIYALGSERKLSWQTSTQSPVWIVNISDNQKIVAACLGDGTIRWYRMNDGELLLSLFIDPYYKHWVLWTPSGYYDVSSGAEELIGWHVNQGADKAALYYPVDKYRPIYYRPDIIDQILETLDEDKALRLANKGANFSNIKSRNTNSDLIPTVRILSPSTGSGFSTNSIDLGFSIKSPNDEPVTTIKIMIDGRTIENERGLKPAGTRFMETIQVPSRNCTVSIIAKNRFGSSEVAYTDLNWFGELETSTKSKLYILAIGVGDYDDDDFDLDYPDEDATAFVEIMQKQEGLLYSDVISKLYTNKTATKDNILDGLDWLVKETTQYDVTMLFLAGHGIEDTHGTFYYLPVNANKNHKRRTCLMKGDIKETVLTVAGKILVFMDACHSGNLMLETNRRGNPDISRVVNELTQAKNGVVVYSSSTGRQSSLENADWGHGAFTKALVEGLEGKAADEQGKITCKSLDLYITERVKQLTSGEQTPTTNYPPNVPDFPISIVE